MVSAMTSLATSQLARKGAVRMTMLFALSDEDATPRCSSGQDGRMSEERGDPAQSGAGYDKLNIQGERPEPGQHE